MTLKRTSSAAFSIFLIFSASFLFLVVPLNAAPSKISAVYAFGDSTLDPGNNNHLGTLFRGDHPPYGRDFPGQIATGRFTDGRLMTDFTVSSLGIKDLLPAYLDPRVSNLDLLTGVSFASAGTGIDDLTATISNVAHMSTQLHYFEQCLARMQSTVGREAASRIVEDALFAIGIGTNDMIFNFYDLPTRRGQFSLPAYHDFLLHNLESFVMRLYSMGARRFSISGLPPIGCLPVQETAGSILPIPGGHMLQRVCNDAENQDSQAYNAKLQALVLRLQATLPGTRFAYVDIYNPLLDMITNPGKYGFVETRRGCCGTGLVEMGGMCNAATPVCPDPSKFVFWDAVHPTQTTYQILANIFTATVIPHLVN
ncbi:PREDICTED: GDSL esterase/lipase At2g40250-like [Nelumbo nucifera]|uniref:GDSL esterase/lipase At2g40250-like n=2 Tax=Nelumbo nucifera TaxID=4432 RepID=A0A1U7ZSA1_NELNU|nr:PREDICTED: GDSL esterase/lipase At2g40250-like [Nelumbo nucifera]DAD26295.1 TPA_asm: hypothetical protein HUJ06_027763 [Nelumbo nucifera]